MISIILTASPEVMKRAQEGGFKLETVLIRHETGPSDQATKAKTEREIFKLQPFQFLVSNYWGMCPD